mmetsp:Transcript_44454/g.122995  ORF Transcript_44454/g.122995 Transcript_44454/m.122995 type:complete len:251 (-) Transcript_44454:1300-2052(-)
MRRYTRTSLSWPIRKARSTACASVAGFHEGSTRTTRSALVKLRPTPPTAVVSSIHWKRSNCLLNLATFSARSTASVWPSMRKHRKPLGLSTQIWIRSSILMLCENTRVRWPLEARAGKRDARQRSFALCRKTASVERGSFRSIISAARPARASSASFAPKSERASLSWFVGTRGSSAPSTSAPNATAGADAELTISDSSSVHTLAFGHGSASSGWLQRRFSRPMARKTSMPNFDFAVASRMISLFSKIFW